MGTRHGSAGQPGKVQLRASAWQGDAGSFTCPSRAAASGPARPVCRRPAGLPSTGTLGGRKGSARRGRRRKPLSTLPPAGPRKWQRREINPQGGCRPEFPFPHHDVLRKSNSLYCPAVWLYLVQRNGTCDARESSIRILQSLGKVYRDTAVQQLLPLWLVRWHAP